ncbi:ABC transporter substrate-binding protein [Actinoplanes sp. TRM 88003]|uniref:ABC transporter substrate-binding protein n=1 Tax=Paractinoplanes aksuensis TaxID=2939490 RepID=A0ABT1DJP4_9ACTN|nr:ABC transporter substrate-binding protein [Actinoplanes aksuensis]MCO8270703.1 ABC transporter substrate-binding protein [Actinoplanes aksuensis]
MRTLRTAAAAALIVTLTACGGATSGAGEDEPSAGAKGTVNLAINPWVGYEANAAVIAHLLEKKMGYTVEKKDLKEEIAWQGFETGEVDAIVENWGHPDLKKTYIEDKKVAVEVGPTGNQGTIGWYVPQWMADKYPDITDWKNLNKYADLFKTSESKGKGQFLAGDPSFVTNDEALVSNLKLNYTVVYSGSEAAIIKAAQQASAQTKPLLFYFYEPQWLFAQEKYVRVKLPEYKEGCDADTKKVACDYPDYVLDKIASKKFADANSTAYQFIKNFTWSNDDQNLVSDYITNQGMSAEKAAEKWVTEHEATWKPWIPAGS